MNVIFGSTGTVGSAVLDALAGRGLPTRAIHHMRTPSARATQHAQVDLSTGAGLPAGLEGADTVFLATGDMTDQVGAELRVVDAAQRAGVRRIVKLSLLAADSEVSHHARVHRAIERAIEDSGLAYTILRPVEFMQNFLTVYAPAIEQGVLHLPFGDAAASFIDVRDIAAVALVCLTSDRFIGRTLDLFGPEPLTFAAVATELSRAIGRPIRYEPCSDADFRAAMAPYSVSPAHADGLVVLLRFHREGRGPHHRPTVLEVTGAAPRSFTAFVQEHAAAWRSPDVSEAPRAASTTADAGTGYGRERPSHNARLTEVGAGTPMGEAMRRYWHPIATSATLTSDAPHRTRVLGEDLVVFRDGQGRAGVVFERCCHRGSSLYYGRIEQDGIRCCYHGWKFDVQGHCLEQACEPGGGRRRDLARQPWYPVEERYGLVFVYMGPPDRKPPLPRWDALDPAEEGDQYYAGWPNPGASVTGLEQEFNWLQMYENGIDNVHVTWLHTAHSGVQLAGTGTTTGLPESFYDPYSIAEKTTYHKTEFGAKYHHRYETTTPDGEQAELEWRLEMQLPNILALPDHEEVTPDARHNLLIWIVPSDDTNHRVFFSIRSGDPGRMQRFFSGIKQNGKSSWEMTEEERQKYPGDVEAQKSQGPITQHSEETLVSSDRGVVMLRRMLRTMIDDVEAGRDPLGVSRVDGPPRRVDAGVFRLSADSGVLPELLGTAPANAIDVG